MLRSSIKISIELKFHPTEKEKKRKVKRRETKIQKKKKEEKNRSPRGCPLCAVDTNFPNKRKNKGLATKEK